MIELLKESKCNNDCDGFTNAEICKECKAYEKHAKSADYLLENDVIVPPVKFGDTVYHLGYSFKVEEIEILQDGVFYRCGNAGTDDYMAFCGSDIGKTVFLTKEQAEKALKGGAE